MEGIMFLKTGFGHEPEPEKPDLLLWPLVAAVALLFAAFAPDLGIISVFLFVVAIGLSAWDAIRFLRMKRP